MTQVRTRAGGSAMAPGQTCCGAPPAPFIPGASTLDLASVHERTLAPVHESERAAGTAPGSRRHRAPTVSRGSETHAGAGYAQRCVQRREMVGLGRPSRSHTDKETVCMFGHKWQEGEGTVREIRVSRLGHSDNSPIITHYAIDV